MTPWPDILGWCLFATSSGVAEASIFCQVSWIEKNKLPRGFDEHFYLNIQRFLVFAILFGSHDGPVVNLIAAGLCFPFFHDGAYYTAYNFFLPGMYPKMWFDESQTTDAKFSMAFPVRAVMLVFSFILWFA